MAKKIAVKQNSEAPISTEVLADSIKAIAEGMRKLRAGRLTDRALYLLIQHAAPNIGGRGYSQLSMKEIKAVFEGIDSLESTYLKKQPSTR